MQEDDEEVEEEEEGDDGEEAELIPEAEEPTEKRSSPRQRRKVRKDWTTLFLCDNYFHFLAFFMNDFMNDLRELE